MRKTLSASERVRRSVARAEERGLIQIHRQIPARDKERIDAFIVKCKTNLRKDIEKGAWPPGANEKGQRL